MAEKKEFEVRLCQLKKTHSEWMSVTTPIEDGELVLTTGANVDGVTVLAALIGDGTSTYSQLYTARKYLCAPASDVYAWAKAATKPEYKASEIKELASYILTQVTTEIGKLDVTDTAVDGQYVSAVSEADGKITVSRKAFADLAGTVFAPASHTHLSDDIKVGQPEDQNYADWVGKTVTEVLEELRSTLDRTNEQVEIGARYVTTLQGGEVGKSVRTIASEELAKQLIPENADEARNTLQEIAAWIQSHPSDASAMNAAITALQLLMTGISGEYATVKAYVEAAISALNIGDYAKSADLVALAARVTVLENQAHTHSNKAVLDGITPEKVREWDAKPGTSDLAAIAFSGSTDDLEQGEKTIILRCTI